MSIAVSLTVAEGKRLIAKGVVASPIFREALAGGRVLVIKGTTNAYIVEEATGNKIDKLNYARGLTLPHGMPRRAAEGAPIGDVLIDHGTVNLNADLNEALEALGPGDLILKGANALNYAKGMTGVLVGDPRSGTVGMALRRAVGSHVRMLIPIGLEKSIGADIIELANLLQAPTHRGPAMMPMWGTIYTEIEALATLAGVKATHVGAGGVGGAEGAVWLALEGSDGQLAEAQQVLDGVYGEAALV
jgi:hypothetical protein